MNDATVQDVDVIQQELDALDALATKHDHILRQMEDLGRRMARGRIRTTWREYLHLNREARDIERAMLAKINQL